MPTKSEIELQLASLVRSSDPSIDVSTGSPMSEVITQVATRFASGVTDADFYDFLVDRLSTDPATSNYDFRTEGSTLKDVIARAFYVVMNPLVAEIRNAERRRSIGSDALTLEEISDIATNFLVPPRKGQPATGRVRLYFSSPQTVNLDASVVFSTATGLQYIPDATYSFTDTDFSREGSLYTVEVGMQSVVNHEGANQEVGTPLFTQFLATMIKAVSASAFTSGVTEDTSATLLGRVTQSISARSLTTKNGIQYHLQSLLPEITSVYVVGYRDPEMARDLLRGNTSPDTATTETILVSASRVYGWPITAAGGSETRSPDPDFVLSNWSGTDQFTWTSVVSLDFRNYNSFLAAWNKMSTATHVRLIHGGSDSADRFHQDSVSRKRKIVSYVATNSSDVKVSYSSNTARRIRVVLNDFSIQASGTSATTVPNKNTRDPQGQSKYLVGVDGNWRGAPLPITDVITLVGSSLSDYTCEKGKDFLVLRGTQSLGTPIAESFMCFPITQKLSNTSLAISRADAYLTRYESSGPNRRWSSDLNTSMFGRGIQVVSFGAPAKGDPDADYATMFNGTNTVDDGVEFMGGVALFSSDPYVTDEELWVEIAEHGSRPEGWQSLGVVVNDFISLAAFRTDSSDMDEDSLFSWWATGRVIQVGSDEDTPNKHFLKITGVRITKMRAGSLLDFGSTYDKWDSSASEGFPEASRFRLHWTVYKGQSDVVLPNNNVITSYTDFQFLPAYNTTGEDFGAMNETAGMFPYVDGNDTVSSFNAESILALGSSVTATANGVGQNRQHRWAILRLPENFNEIKLGNGETYVSQVSLATTVTPGSAIDATLKYDEGIVIDGFTRYVVPRILPFSYMEWRWEDLGGDTVLTRDGSTSNTAGIGGFIVGRLFGNVNGENTAQILGTVEAQSGSGSITVSDIPGAMPFTVDYGLPLTVASDAVHIGGMVDVYIKASSLESDSATFKVSPENPDELLVEDTSASMLSDDPYQLFSPDVFSQLADPNQLLLCSVLIYSSPQPSLVGKAFRVIGFNESTSKIRVAVPISLAGTDIGPLHIKLLLSNTQDLRASREVLHVGHNLTVMSDRQTCSLTYAHGISSSYIGKLVLRIRDGVNAGEYQVESISATGFKTTSKIPAPGSGIGFELISKVSAIELPMVAIDTVVLSDGEGSGIEVPSSEPLCCEFMSGGALNNDVLTISDESIVLRPAGTYGGLGGDLDPSHAAGTFAYAHMYSTDDAFSWVSEGIIVYDSVVTNEGEYFWVRSIEGTSVLVLDRNVSTTSSGINIEAGKPLASVVRMFFKSPTYIELDSNSKFTHTNGLTFRASPGENAIIRATTNAESDGLLTPSSVSEAELTTDTVDFSRIGARVGDSLEVVTTVLRSATRNTTQQAAFSGLTGLTLFLTVNGKSYNITFKNTSMNVARAVAEMNAALAGTCHVSATTGTSIRLLISSIYSVVVKDGSAGVLSILGLTQGSTNSYVESSLSVIQSISFSSGTTTVALGTSDGPSVFSTVIGAVYVHYRVIRKNTQIVFPSAMTLHDNGLYYCDVTLTSKQPFSGQSVSRKDILTVDADTIASFGYKIRSNNDSLTFSTAEDSSFVFTAIVLPKSAKALDEAVCVLQSSVTVKYTRSSVVDSAQSLMLSNFTREVAANPLVRHYLPIVMYLTARVSSNKTAAELKQGLASLLSRNIGNRPITSFEVQKALIQLGVTSIVGDIDVRYLVSHVNRSRTLEYQSGVPTSRVYSLLDDMSNVKIR